MTSQVPAPPTSPPPPKAEDTRTETLRLLDAVFPEVSATLSESEVNEALTAIEIRFQGSGGMGLHVFAAGRLWVKHWEKLLVPAVRTRLRRNGVSATVSEAQIFETASRLPPPQPSSESDGLCWSSFSDAVARDLRSTIMATAERNKDPEAERSAEEARARQEAFAQNFRRRLEDLRRPPKP